MVIALAAAQPALADPIPAGTYDVRMLSGAIDVGTFLPAVALPPVGPVPIPIGTQPVNQAIGDLAVQPTQFSVGIQGGAISGTLTPTVTSPSATLDPATGNVSLDFALYATATINVTGLVSGSTTCTLGTAGQPIVVHMSTASGVPWSANTGNFSLADKTFAVPAPECSDGTLGALFALVVGNTGTGNNSATVVGNATRQPDPAPSPTPTTQPDASITPTGSQPATQPGSTTAPRTPARRACVVPNLRGMSRARARRALTRAGCRLGRVRTNRRSRSRAGTVVRQGRRVGARLPAGTSVAITVAGRHSR